MPEVYDRELGPVLFAPVAAHVAAIAAALNPGRVLELAAGTGVATAALVRSMPTADIVATDLNAAMVSWAAERVAGATWQQADAQALDFADACFDLVVCQFGVMFFPDRKGAFAEAARVLTPGGTLLFTVWDVVETSPMSAALAESVTALLPDDPPDFVTRVPHGYADPDQIVSDVTAGGLVRASVDRLVVRGRAASARGLADGFCLGTPLRFALAERGSLEDLTHAVGAEMTARLGEGPVEGDMAFFTVTARKPA
jgi:SAM-dependent methyltransferase